MTEENNLNKYLNNANSPQDRLIEEIPTTSPTPYPDRVPSGYEPMGEIRLRGRAASGFSRGRMPWWILITGWVIFGSISLMLIFVSFQAIANKMFFAAIFPLVITFILISILWRGTKAKLGIKKRKRRLR